MTPRSEAARLEATPGEVAPIEEVRRWTGYVGVTFVYLFLYPDRVATCPVLPDAAPKRPRTRLAFLNNPAEEIQNVGL